MGLLRLFEYLGVIAATIALLLYAVKVATGRWPWEGNKSNNDNESNESK